MIVGEDLIRRAVVHHLALLLATWHVGRHAGAPGTAASSRCGPDAQQRGDIVGILVIDAGTSSIRTCVVDADGAVHHERHAETLPDSPASVSSSSPPRTPRRQVAGLRDRRTAAGTVEGVGISNQRGSTVVDGHRAGRPPMPGLAGPPHRGRLPGACRRALPGRSTSRPPSSPQHPRRTIRRCHLTGTYDEQDRLRTYGNWAYTYTDNGELSSKLNTANNDLWSYEYDAMGNLRSVTLPDDRVVSYAHDARNRRIASSSTASGAPLGYGDQLNPCSKRTAMAYRCSATCTRAWSTHPTTSSTPTA